MARVFNQADYTHKRNEILDAALRKVYTVGYDSMSIQDILDDLKISKGAFYHYFESKPDLLHGIISRMMDEIFLAINPILDDASLDALAKFKNYFMTASIWKSQRLEQMLPIIRVWYADETILVREKIYSASEEKIVPFLSGIIRQGVNEGTFHTNAPDESAHIVYGLMFALGVALSRQLLRPPPGGIDEARLFKLTDEYTRVIEITLGMQRGSVEIFTHATLHQWIETIVPHMQA